MQVSAAQTEANGAPRPLREIDELPGPRGWPWLGNLPQIDRACMHRTVEAWARRYGPIFRFDLPGRRMLAVADHEAIAALLRDRPDGFRRSLRLEQVWFEMGLDPGVFGATGDIWRRQRRMVMAGFDPVHVKAYFPALRAVADRLRQRWARAAKAKQAIDLQADLTRYTVDAITGLAFGSDLHTLESDDDVIQQHLDRIFPALFRRIMAPFPLWRYLRLPADRRLDRSIVEVRRAIDAFIAQARARLDADPARRERPINLLEAMIVASEVEGSGVDDRDVAGNVLTMLLAGEDTTAHTLAWLIHLLHRHPQALQRAQQEARSLGATADDITPDRLSRLDYLDACIQETMRLKPVAPFMGAQACRETQIADVRVPAGTIVWCALRSDSLQERHFTDAAAFRPERWLADDAAALGLHAARRVAMPFGVGPRICPGRYLALLEMKLAMTMLLQHFDVASVSTPDGGEAVERLSFTMAPVGLRMRLRERAAA